MCSSMVLPNRQWHRALSSEPSELSYMILLPTILLSVELRRLSLVFITAICLVVL